jgi:hypothetical protein
MDKHQFENLLGDEDFERLELSLKEPNIFRALKVERREIRHSNFIAYLLDPNENHGLNEILLKKVLQEIFSEATDASKAIYYADEIDYGNVEVRREWRNIDILIITENEVLVIENKVDTEDHSNQLERYKEISKSAFPDKNRVYIYLTPFGTSPRDEVSARDYINYSYQSLAEHIERILNLYQNRLSEKVQYYIRDYLLTVKREILMNDTLNETAVKIYKHHKEVLNFIFDNKPDELNELKPFFISELQNRGFVIGTENKWYIRFTTEFLMVNLPKAKKGWKNLELFLFEITFNREKIVSIKAVISDGTAETARQILETVETQKNFKQPRTNIWSTFYSKSIGIKYEDILTRNDSEIKLIVGKIIDKFETEVKDIAKTIENGIKTGRITAGIQ